MVNNTKASSYKGFGKEPAKKVEQKRTAEESAHRLADVFDHALKTFPKNESDTFKALMQKALIEANFKCEMPCIIIDVSFNIIPGNLKTFTEDNFKLKDLWQKEGNKWIYLVFLTRNVTQNKLTEDIDESAFVVQAVPPSYIH